MVGLTNDKCRLLQDASILWRNTAAPTELWK